MPEMMHKQDKKERHCLQESYGAHPLRGRDSSWLDDYMRGQLILRKEGKTLDKGGTLLRSFAVSLGISLEHLAELELEISQYDEQSNGEIWVRLSELSKNANDTVYFMFDMARLHGESYSLEGEFLDLWNNVCMLVFHVNSSQTAFLQRYAARIAKGEKHWSKNDFGNDSQKIPWLGDGNYLVIDLSGGPQAVYYPCRSTDSPPNPAEYACRTTELWLRRIHGGSFMMGSPENETGRNIYEAEQHRVTLTRDYYIGVFQCTQRQYELVMGINPSRSFSGATHPVDGVSYHDLRAWNTKAKKLNPFRRRRLGSIGTKWPDDPRVSKDSFFGRLQAKTGLPLDLPTEAEWEYACRAGTTTALNSGKNLADQDLCPNLNALGWYFGNSNGTTHPVGQKMPNAWGLYDMHGNVWEWCLDWFPDYHWRIPEVDPRGPSWRAIRVPQRVCRGGAWNSSPDLCRSGNSDNVFPDFLFGDHFIPNFTFQDIYGFRVAMHT